MAVLPPRTLDLTNGKRVLLRSLTALDADAFLKFQPQVARETNFTLQVDGITPAVEKFVASWTAAETQPVDLRIGAFDNDAMVGLLGLHGSAPPHPWTRHVAAFGMMILKIHWGTGLASAILQAAETHARSQSVRRIEAMVRTKNVRGVAFYKKMGYSIEGTRRMGAIIDGEPHDEFHIAKLL